MALNNSNESDKSFTTCETTSKASVKAKTENDGEPSKIPKSVSTKKYTQCRARTADSTKTRTKIHSERSASANGAECRSFGLKKPKSETQDNYHVFGREENRENRSKFNEKPKSSTEKLKITNSAQEVNNNIYIFKKPSETFSKLYRESNSFGNRSAKPRLDSQRKRLSEIPIKIKKIDGRENSKFSKKSRTSMSKSFTKGKELEQKHTDNSVKSSKQKIFKPKKEIKAEERIKNALNENFSALVPLYEAKLKKIMDSWVNIIYCSLSMRANLVKLLLPDHLKVDRTHFQVEDDTILNFIIRTKAKTKAQGESLIQLIKSIVGSRNMAKEDYNYLLSNKEIAASYDYDWKSLSTKITDLEEETKNLRKKTLQLEKKKETLIAETNEKIQTMEQTLSSKEEEIKKLSYQLGVLQQRENSFKGNILLKVDEYNDIKAEVISLKSVEKDLEELKKKYTYQNEIFRKKVKDLQGTLEEKIKTLEKETEAKKQMEAICNQIHARQKHLCRAVGKDQMEFIMGQSSQGRNKRREQLWLSAVGLVLKGFIVQTKKLERDRNKMLLELNSNDLENFNAAATAIIQKDHFIKSLKHQMDAFIKATKCQKSPDNSFAECLTN